jgi:hypothetical protein
MWRFGKQEKKKKLNHWLYKSFYWIIKELVIIIMLLNSSKNLLQFTQHPLIIKLKSLIL